MNKSAFFAIVGAARNIFTEIKTDRNGFDVSNLKRPTGIYVCGVFCKTAGFHDLRPVLRIGVRRDIL